MNKLEVIKIITSEQPYYNTYNSILVEEQKKAKELCYRYNQSSPLDNDLRKDILAKLLGTYSDMVGIEPSFHCDYGFNIHTEGLVIINYNCVILDTSPVHIGNGTFIAPGVCIACSGHAMDPTQRAEGIGYSKPITIEENVWIGANSTICGGVTIGKGSVIGAGSVVNHDIPAGVVAAGVPCKVIREITEKDKIDKSMIAF